MDSSHIIFVEFTDERRYSHLDPILLDKELFFNTLPTSDLSAAQEDDDVDRVKTYRNK